MTPGFDALLAAARAAPRDRTLAFRLGSRALDERREEDALPVVAAAAEGAPGDAALLQILGLLHRAVGDLGAAIAVLDRAIAAGTPGARLVHARARVAADAGLDSRDWYVQARALAPSDGDVILGHAAAHLAAGDTPAAEATLVDMLRQHPGWLSGHAALIRLRTSDGRAGEALAVLDTAIAGAPADPRLHQLKIMSLHRAGRFDRAAAAIADARAALGDTPLLVAATAMTATEAGRLDEAKAAFARLDPATDADLAVHWLRQLLRRKDFQRAAVFAEGLPPALAALARPYLALAWRAAGDPRAAWLDDPRFVKVIDFGVDWPVIGPLAAALRPLHVSRSQPLDQSVRGGTQTDGPLLSRLDPAIRAVRNRLSDEVASYIAGLPLGDAAHPFLAQVPRRPRFAGSWSVRLAGGGHHDPHIHGEGWLSSAFYVAAPPQGPGDAGALTLGEPQPSLGLDLPPQRIVAAIPGRLVLFPSTLWHGTRPFPAGERLTLAFDIA